MSAVIEAEKIAAGSLSVQTATAPTAQEMLTNTAESAAEAIFREATRYYYGFDDTFQDFEQALKLFRQAANLGYAEAWDRLGAMTEEGEGCAKDERKALQLYEKAAMCGFLPAYAKLANLFRNLNEEENSQKCWSRFFHDHNFGRSANSAGVAVSYIRFVRDRELPLVFRSEILTIKTEILDYLHRSIDIINTRDDLSSLDPWRLSWNILLSAVERDLTPEALELVPEELIERGDFCIHSLDIEEIREGYNLYSRAAVMGSSLAYFRLGWVFTRRTNRTEQDLDRALNWFHKAAESGEDRSFGEIANILEGEHQITRQLGRSRSEAAEYWERYFTGRTFKLNDQIDGFSDRVGNTVNYLLSRFNEDGLRNLKYKDILTPLKQELLDAIRERKALGNPNLFGRLLQRVKEVL